MAVAPPPPDKKPLSEAQRAHLDRLAERNRAVHASKAQPPTGRQTFLARKRNLRQSTFENAEELEEADVDGRTGVRRPLSEGRLAGRITVEHETDMKVKMWKRGPYGWFPREVPSHTIANNLANGWMEYCPDCGGTDCDLDPNTCSVKRGRQYIVCPVIQANGTPCAKKIFATGLAQVNRPAGEFEVTGYGQITAEAELRGKMDLHMMTYHRDEARIYGLFAPRQEVPPGVEILAPEEIIR